MKWAPHAAVLLVLAATLSGCSGGGDGGETSQDPIAEGKGAIRGILVDDVYRTVPGALVLVQGQGLTATTDQDGQFQILDLAPATYILVASAPGYEMSPLNVDVEAGKYADIEYPSRRIFSDDGHTVTSEYSFFIPFAYDYVANGEVRDCTLDQSGDSYRPGYTSDYRAYNKTATYLIVEMKANKADRYEVQLREDNGGGGGGDRYAVAQFEGDYLRMQFRVGEVNEVYNGQDNNVPFNLTKPIALILFSDSVGREELQDAGVPVCCGVGIHFGIKAKFIQTLFIGEPREGIDIDRYCVLASTC